MTSIRRYLNYTLIGVLLVVMGLAVTAAYLITRHEMEEIFDVYGLPDDTRQALWECYQVLASDVLIRFGELDPEIGHSEQNGQS